jgi:hypothetical protein
MEQGEAASIIPKQDKIPRNMKGIPKRPGEMTSRKT